MYVRGSMQVQKQLHLCPILSYFLRYDHVRPKPLLAFRSIDPISEPFNGKPQSFGEASNEGKWSS